tara:strand:+ start:415 stop:576 length:162 start_codon:yes stop_codon:yes gene_type:complete
MDNDAFAQDPHLELCHILKIIANDIRDIDDTDCASYVRDINGNKIGTWKIIGE